MSDAAGVSGVGNAVEVVIGMLELAQEEEGSWPEPSPLRAPDLGRHLVAGGRRLPTSR
jgi:hypothetical protein